MGCLLLEGVVITALNDLFIGAGGFIYFPHGSKGPTQILYKGSRRFCRKNGALDLILRKFTLLCQLGGDDHPLNRDFSFTYDLFFWFHHQKKSCNNTQPPICVVGNHFCCCNQWSWLGSSICNFLNPRSYMASEGNGCWWSCRSLSHLFEWNTGMSAATGLGGIISMCGKMVVDGCVGSGRFSGQFL